ncbi:MAG: formylmethanofuran dehydrogenase subunit A [Candidatus Bathyarchaeia archaeon]
MKEGKAIIIKNGFVYDPRNKVYGDRMDISIEDGRIVEDVRESEALIIDAKDMLVLPGGVDIHSHIAGSKVNLGRLMRPEDHRRSHESSTRGMRSGVGHTVPSTFATGYRYARMGYTTVFEPASPPLKQRHTHHELNDIPILDKACFPLVGDNWFVLEYLSKGDLEACAAYIAWLLEATRGYALKIVNPGGIEAWGWGRNVRSLDDEVPYFRITPREILRGLCRVNRLLGLPHTIHVHANQIGVPGNYGLLIETLKAVKRLGYGCEGKSLIHITHCQFNSYGGESWLTLSSEAEAIAKYVNRNPYVTIDLGQPIFADATTMTADGPFQYSLYLLTGAKWSNADVEAETSAGIVPIRFRKRNRTNAIQWAIGLELALLIKDPWRVFLTTDHPNAGPFTAYPRVIAWLMSKRAREATMKGLHPMAMKRCILPSLDREYDFSEMVIVTRAGTAKALGLKEKGHLGVGAHGDVAIYSINPKALDPSRDFKALRKGLRRTAYTIKGGVVVAKDGVITNQPIGRTYWVKARVRSDLSEAVLKDVKARFKDYYTIQFENYALDDRHLAFSEPIAVSPML